MARSHSACCERRHARLPDRQLFLLLQQCRPALNRQRPPTEPAKHAQDYPNDIVDNDSHLASDLYSCLWYQLCMAPDGKSTMPGNNTRKSMRAGPPQEPTSPDVQSDLLVWNQLRCSAVQRQRRWISVHCPPSRLDPPSPTHYQHRCLAIARCQAAAPSCITDPAFAATTSALGHGSAGACGCLRARKHPG